MRKLTKVTGERFLDQIVQNTSFEHIAYEEVEFWGCQFLACAWTDARFSRITFCHGTTFTDCRFVRCRFTKQHTYFGGPSRFTNCAFEDCHIENVQFFETVFEDCSFTGKLVNVLFYGPDAPAEWQSILRNVDMSGAQIELVGFESGIDLSTTRLPNRA